MKFIVVKVKVQVMKIFSGNFKHHVYLKGMMIVS